MKEIELKILEIDIKEITKKLLTLGAKKTLKRTLLIEKIFDYPNNTLKRRDQLLRLRVQNKKVFLTFKYDKVKDKHFKIAKEDELMIDHPERLERIFKHLGLVVGKYHEKYRTSYILNKVAIEIDEYPTIPAYLETEGPIKATRTVLNKLGYKISDTTNLNSSQVLKKYHKNLKLQKFKQS